MNDSKRNRGRPTGTGKDDQAVLEAVADRMIADPDVRATTAMRRVAPKAGEADIRRYQVKWKAGKERLLEAAQRRAQQRRAADAARLPVPATYGPSQWLTEHGIGRLLESPMLRALRERPETLVERAMRTSTESAATRILRDYQNSPIQRAMWGYLDSPMMRAMRAVEDSPLQRAIRQHEEMAKRLSGRISGGRP